MGARLTDRAGRRVDEVGPVVGLPVVVAGRPEAERDPQDEDRRRNQAGRMPWPMSGEKNGDRYPSTS